MKLLALTIGNYPISTPQALSAINSLSLSQIIQFAVTLLLSIAVLLSFIFVVVAGLKWMLSQGDKKGVEEAQKTLTYAIIGLIVALLAIFIINIIGYLFGVNLTHIGS